MTSSGVAPIDALNVTNIEAEAQVIASCNQFPTDPQTCCSIGDEIREESGRSLAPTKSYRYPSFG